MPPWPQEHYFFCLKLSSVAGWSMGVSVMRVRRAFSASMTEEHLRYRRSSVFRKGGRLLTQLVLKRWRGGCVW